MNNSYKRSNFGAAFFFLSKEQRKALSTVYAFCRMADDIVDDTPETAPQQLMALRKEIDLVFQNKAGTELGKDLQIVVSKYAIPKGYFLGLLEGVGSDVKTLVRFKTQEDLNWYMYRVASIVGLMCIEIFGYKNPLSKEYAITLGYAVQLTNILRDICEDAKINRLYLPLEDLEKFKIKETDILAIKQSEEIKKLLAFEAQKAHVLYDKAREILPQEDFKTLLPARAMGAIYEEILSKFKQKSCTLQEKKIKLSKVTKLLILFRTWSNK